MKTTRLPKFACLACGSVHDAATHPTGNHKPKKGDIFVCVRCGAPAIFENPNTIRQMTEKEKAEEMKVNPDLVQVQTAVRMLRN